MTETGWGQKQYKQDRINNGYETCHLDYFLEIPRVWIAPQTERLLMHIAGKGIVWPT